MVSSLPWPNAVMLKVKSDRRLSKREWQHANPATDCQKFIGDAPDVIVPITMPAAQSMIGGTSDILIVFAMVTDPVKAQLITQYIQPGGNVTGVSDAAPIEPQLDLFCEYIPGLKNLGFIYNPGLDNALATLETINIHAQTRGINIIESPAPTTNEVILAAKKLIGEVAGDMVADVFDGKPVGEIDAAIAYKVVDRLISTVNKGAAERMGLAIPDAVLSRATLTVD